MTPAKNNWHFSGELSSILYLSLTDRIPSSNPEISSRLDSCLRLVGTELSFTIIGPLSLISSPALIKTRSAVYSKPDRT